MFLREDNSGIGHKRDVQDECTGLDAFQDILGRLNGKIEDQVEKEKKARGDYKRSLYTERKYGGVSFVRGGFLVGDETESVKDESENGDLTPDVCMNTEPQATLTAECETGPTKTPRRDKKERKERKDKKEKKRKASDHYPNSDRISRNKKRWKSEDGSRESTDFKASSLSSGDQSLTSSSRKIFKEKKFKSEPTFGDKGKQDKSKKDKRSKKWNDKSTNKAEDSEGLSSASGSREILMSPPPSVLGMTSHPPVDARRLHRSRFIAQKRAAVMDNAALNQVFTSYPVAIS